MSITSFLNLVELLRPGLEVDETQSTRRGTGTICAGYCTYITIRYLSGGSHLDIMAFTKISKPSFYVTTDKTILAICRCEALEIRFPSDISDFHHLSSEFEAIISEDKAINNCVGVLDGYLQAIQTPKKTETKNQKSFFSGHYTRNGVNVQAIADHNSSFIYFSMQAPWSFNDRAAIKEFDDGGHNLHGMIESIPFPYVVIGDAAYECTNSLISLCYGVNAEIPQYSDFNYFASSCRIRIEMAFGLMMTKWCILQTPLINNLDHIRNLLLAVARLHNYCIAQRIEHNGHWNPAKEKCKVKEILTVDLPDLNEWDPRNGYSLRRQSMVDRVVQKGLHRPKTSVLSKANDAI